MRNENVRGFRLQLSEVKVLAYADDIAVFCEDRDSVLEVVHLVKKYCEQSGSQINWQKSIGIWHGHWDIIPAHFANIRWSTTPTKYLGVPLEHYNDTAQYWSDEADRMSEKSKGWLGQDLSMFGRASVCNLFLVAKVWYIMQVLSMCRSSVQKMHRVFAVFIWASSWERISRTNLFRSARSGGLGLSHLFIRQIVSRFLFFRDQRNDFLRTVIQVRLGKALPQYVVTTSDVKGGSIRGYLREVVDSLRMLRVRFSMEYLCSVTRKTLYKDLVDTMLPIPLYRSVNWGGQGDDVLKRVKKMPVRPSQKTFFFKLHTNTLPVKTWLDEKGIYVPWTVNCLLCKKPETIEHVFIDCWDPTFHWDILQRTLKKELPITPLGIRYLPTDNEGGVPYDMFMLLGLHSLWKTRMAVRHSDVDTRPARINFIESVAYIREIYRAQSEPPEWVAILDELIKLKRF
ncbi:uncharacterized protein LOC142564983 [Dermacentor variabilis]|uniref:uncharacterized protein LOC142564983 n=2 Tax=Dermacentor variabilis TaxID=34621 RepID=UPI003F5C6140